MNQLAIMMLKFMHSLHKVIVNIAVVILVIICKFFLIIIINLTSDLGLHQYLGLA